MPQFSGTAALQLLRQYDPDMAVHLRVRHHRRGRRRRGDENRRARLHHQGPSRNTSARRSSASCARPKAACRGRNSRKHGFEHMAYHDSLTDLPNRVLLHDRLQQAILAAQRGGDRSGWSGARSRRLQGHQRLASAIMPAMARCRKSPYASRPACAMLMPVARGGGDVRPPAADDAEGASLGAQKKCWIWDARWSSKASQAVHRRQRRHRLFSGPRRQSGRPAAARGHRDLQVAKSGGASAAPSTRRSVTAKRTTSWRASPISAMASTAASSSSTTSRWCTCNRARQCAS